MVLGGSVATRLPGLREALTARLVQAGHAADIRPAGDTSIGAAVLALRHQGVRVDEALLARLMDSAAALSGAARTSA